jgi:hypothetical protein
MNGQPGDEERPGGNEQPGDGKRPGGNEQPGDGDQPGDGKRPWVTEAGAGQGVGALAVIRAEPRHTATALAGLREPIVVILLLIAFFSSISGKPLDGLLILVAGVSLAWDAGRRARRGGPAETRQAVGGLAGGRAADGQAAGDHAADGQAAGDHAGDGQAGGAHAAGDHAADRQAGGDSATVGRGADGYATWGSSASLGAAPAAARWRRPLLGLVWLAGGALYVLVVGSFSRYSWPATVAVAGLGAVVVVMGWGGPRRSRPAPARLPASGLVLWGLVLVAGGLWELSALLEQPALAISSYAHPTISTLTDPVLSTWAGRSVFLAGWLALGWFVVER